MTSREPDVLLSSVQKAFIIKALQAGIRADARKPLDARKTRYIYALDDSSCTVLLGQTRVMSVVTANLEAPYPDRPNEGSVRFNVEFSPMASPNFESGRPGEAAIELARLVERSLRETRAIDQEALCVLAGRKVWAVRVDVHVLDNCGNMADAAALSALGALLAFRRPDVTVGPGETGDVQAVTVHSPDVREPVPLSIHHLPLAVTFAFFGAKGEQMVLDPTLLEEAAASGFMTVIVNSFGELCALQKANGIGISSQEVIRLLGLADAHVKRRVAELQASLKTHELERVQARIRRHAQAVVPSSLQGDRVAVLRSHELADAAQLAAAAAAAAAVGTDGEGLLETSSEEESDKEDGAQAADADMADVVEAATQQPEAQAAAASGQEPVVAVTGQQQRPPSDWRGARPPKQKVHVKQEEGSDEAQFGVLAARLAGAGTSADGSQQALLQEAIKPHKKLKTKRLKQEPV